MEDYFSALAEEIKRKGSRTKRTVNHIYIGGGTPSVAYKFFPLLKKAVFESFDVSSDAEISMECNPESVTSEFVFAAKDLGVNRVSVGVQTLSDPLLSAIGRAHDKEGALKALDLLTSNFASVNADVMVGLPGQTFSDLDQTLDLILSYPLNHISCYSLILEEGTPLFAAAARGEFLPDDDLAVDLYDRAKKRLFDAGFRRYEISNFCKDGAVCGYNYSVWQYAEYLGLGLGASSFLRDNRGFVREKNTDDLSLYLSSFGKGGREKERILKNEAMREFAMLGLRLEEGCDTAAFKARFGVDFFNRFGDKIEELNRYLFVSDVRVAILPEFFYVSNSIIEQFIF